MRNTDLGQQFNKFKKQFTMKEELTELFDESYNIAVERCINYCQSQVSLYKAISPNGNEWRAIESIARTLEYFKKPIKEETK